MSHMFYQFINVFVFCIFIHVGQKATDLINTYKITKENQEKMVVCGGGGRE